MTISLRTKYEENSPWCKVGAHLYMNEMTVFDKTVKLWTEEMMKQEFSRWCNMSLKFCNYYIYQWMIFYFNELFLSSLVLF